MTAKASTRSSGKLTIGFGMVAVPVALYSTVDEDAGAVKRHQFSPAGNSIAYLKVDSETRKEVPASEIVMRYAAEDGTQVELTDDEIAVAMGQENGQCELIGFFDLEDLGVYQVASTLAVRPQTAKAGKVTTHPYDKAFMLLIEGMAEQSTFALLKYTLRGKPRLGALTPDGNLLVLRWADEIRDVLPMPEVTLAAEELAVASTLVGQLMYDGAPQIENDAIARVREYAAVKATGTAPEMKAEAVIEVDDLMAALKASLSTVDA